MRRSGILLVSALCLLISFSMGAADTRLDNYYAETAEHFGSPPSAITEVLAFEPDSEDVPVIFMLAQMTGVLPAKIAELRARGDSWHSVMKVRGVSAQDLYVMISADFESAVYSPIFEKYESTPQSEWKGLALSDEDIVNLVNLRFIYRSNGYSVFEVMAMRDHGKPFPTINQQIADLKKKMIAEEKAALKVKAKAKKASE